MRAAGSQGVQNGSISCVALVLSVPGGTRAILGENVLAAWLDLEVASGNDAIASHSEIRKTAKLMGQFLPGTDFVTSGYSVMPRHDNTFGGGNFDADDLDEWLTIQRDWQVDAGIEPLAEDEVCASASGRRGRCRRPSPSSGSRPSRTQKSRRRRPATTPPRCRTATGPPTSRRRTTSSREASPGSTSRSRWTGAGSPTSPRRSSAMQRQRISADYLQTAAVVDRDGLVHSAVNDPNVYSGPGTGYRLEGERWELLQSLPNVVDPADLLGGVDDAEPVVLERGEAAKGAGPDEVVVAVGPAFADAIRETIAGLDHREVLAAICEGIRDGGAQPRLVRVRRVADVAFIAHDGARLSGSGVALGIQSKGTARDPPGRPRAARQPRAVRHVAALHARVVPGDGPQRGRVRARSAGSAPSRPSSTTSPARS